MKKYKVTFKDYSKITEGEYIIELSKDGTETKAWTTFLGNCIVITRLDDNGCPLPDGAAIPMNCIKFIKNPYIKDVKLYPVRIEPIE